MALILKSNLIFLHFPKTGGSFIKEVFKKNNLVIKEIKSDGENVPLYTNQWGTQHNQVNFKTYPSETYQRFFFIREPIEWYISYINFKLTTKKVNKSYYFDNLICKNSANVDRVIDLIYQKKSKPMYEMFLQWKHKENTKFYKYEEISMVLDSLFPEQNFDMSKTVNKTKKKFLLSDASKDKIRIIEKEIYSLYKEKTK